LLETRERHLIDLHVSQLNGCGYCLSAHAALARMDGIEDVEALRAGDVGRPSWPCHDVSALLTSVAQVATR
jgi:AhpD family alkylhydroperoxidase